MSGVPSQVHPVPSLPAVSVQDLDFGFHTGGERPTQPGTGTPWLLEESSRGLGRCCGSDYVDVIGNVVYSR
jgi:hypothetical protein